MWRRRAAAFSIGFCVLFSLAAFAAPKPDAGSAPVQTQAAAKSAYHHELICETKPVVGSHIRQRTCRTRAEIDAERLRGQRQVNEVMGPPPISPVFGTARRSW